MDDRKSIIDRVMEATDATKNRVQQGVSGSPVMSATKERAEAVRQRAQAAALAQLNLATREDVARIQAAVNDLAKRVPAGRAAKPRAPRAKAAPAQDDKSA